MKSKKATEELGLYLRWGLNVTHRQSLCSVYPDFMNDCTRRLQKKF